MSLLHSLYQLITLLLSPFIKAFFLLRALQGKEDKSRLNERWGIPALDQRPKGPIYWIHAVSVGEANSALILVKLLQQLDPLAHILMTTGTVTSAKLMADRLPPGASHQYLPIDTPFAVRSFLDFWEPELALWVESEVWPNLLLEIKHREIPLLSVNGRMSSRSYKRWQGILPFIRPLMETFSWCGVQTAYDQEAFRILGARSVHVMPNLKLLADPQRFSHEEYETLSEGLGDRFVWFASCTHPGEEEQLMEAHKLLLKTHPTALMFLAPRHINRIEDVRKSLEKMNLTFSSRSSSSLPNASKSVYIIDSMGELGLFYRMSPITFIGGTWVPKGGHNPVEATQAGSFVVHGMHTSSNQALYEILDSLGLAYRVDGPEMLCEKLLEGPPQKAEPWSHMRDSGLEDLKALLSQYVGGSREVAC
jgi:3-deoxy-D-manno-octulosonic-acid transferase